MSLNVKKVPLGVVAPEAMNNRVPIMKILNGLADNPDAVLAPKTAVDRFDPKLTAATKKPDTKDVIVDMTGYVSTYGLSFDRISAALKDAKKKDITALLNSPGGDVFEGIAIYNLLRAYPGKVTIRVVGIAASAASVIAMAADRLEMMESSSMMIHNVWGGMVGDKKDMRDFADVLEAQDTNLAEIYSARTGRKVDDVTAMMEKETWMSAKKALAEKFTDAVIPNKERDDEEGKNSATAAASGQSRGVRISPQAAGTTSAGASANPPMKSKENEMKKSTAELLAAAEAKRAASVARMDALMDAADEAGTTLDKAQAEEHDTLKGEVEQLDEHIGRLKERQARDAASANRVDKGAAGENVDIDPSRQRNSGTVTVKSNAPKGTAFTRYVCALAMSKGNVMQAIAMAEARQDWKDSTPVVAKALRAAAIAPGSTTDGSWAGPLVDIQMMADEFIELLRPATIIGKITGFRRVPFNVKMPRQLTGSTVGWVGQGAPKPVSRLTFDSVSLGFSKVAGIVVITDELARLSTPSAESLVRQDLIDTIAQFQDEQFINPSVSAVANVSPASVTNGVTPVPVAGSTVDQIDAAVQGAMQGYIDAKINLANGVWVMNPRSALSLSLKRTASGEQKAYPDITPQGGKWHGLPVITSESVPVAGTSGNPTIIALLNASDILLADDGGIGIDVSREASLQMDSAPETGGQAELVSLWQMNLLGIRAERWINYYKRRSASVQYISEVEF